MIRQKSKFFTFILSCIPGAGHMYLGFMKQGVSLMSLFFFLTFLGSWLQTEFILFCLPIIWFFSFFDANNKNTLDPNIFSQLKDNFLFPIEINQFHQLKLGKLKTLMASVLILIGGSMIIDLMLNLLSSTFPSIYWGIFYRLVDTIPKLIFAGVIVLIGVRLIQNKKSELNP